MKAATAADFSAGAEIDDVSDICKPFVYVVAFFQNAAFASPSPKMQLNHYVELFLVRI